VNARLGKTIGFRPEREGSGAAGHDSGFHSVFSDISTSKRYNLTASIPARNLRNHRGDRE